MQHSGGGQWEVLWCQVLEVVLHNSHQDSTLQLLPVDTQVTIKFSEGKQMHVGTEP